MTPVVFMMLFMSLCSFLHYVYMALRFRKYCGEVLRILEMFHERKEKLIADMERKNLYQMSEIVNILSNKKPKSLE